ncbi:unnamed protein product [Caenorhabditis bovis]|uniref:Uncharacterized protein n=1 Tax=Caenorhabditis bovis TaxID=2654633 RepID=A0A8S1FFS2_9PELO|nr:unnamed protein product [Caenorhabditis bovis]
MAPMNNKRVTSHGNERQEQRPRAHRQANQRPPAQRQPSQRIQAQRQASQRHQAPRQIPQPPAAQLQQAQNQGFIPPVIQPVGTMDGTIGYFNYMSGGIWRNIPISRMQYENLMREGYLALQMHQPPPPRDEHDRADVPVAYFNIFVGDTWRHIPLNQMEYQLLMQQEHLALLIRDSRPQQPPIHFPRTLHEMYCQYGAGVPAVVAPWLINRENVEEQNGGAEQNEQQQ